MASAKSPQRFAGAGAAALFIAAAVFVWLLGLFAVGRYAEDFCFRDLDSRPGYGSYRSESSLWPPAFECHLAGSDVESVSVEHHLLAFARFGTTVVFPAAAGIALVLLVRRRRA